MKKLLGLLVISILFIGCTDKDGAERTLAQQGYKNIKITGYKVLGCSKDDLYSTGFEANTMNGIRVKGVICSGVLKGSTIRTY